MDCRDARDLLLRSDGPATGPWPNTSPGARPAAGSSGTWPSSRRPGADPPARRLRTGPRRLPGEAPATRRPASGRAFEAPADLRRWLVAASVLVGLGLGAASLVSGRRASARRTWSSGWSTGTWSWPGSGRPTSGAGSTPTAPRHGRRGRAGGPAGRRPGAGRTPPRQRPLARPERRPPGRGRPLQRPGRPAPPPDDRRHQGGDHRRVERSPGSTTGWSSWGSRRSSTSSRSRPPSISRRTPTRAPGPPRRRPDEDPGRPLEKAPDSSGRRSGRPWASPDVLGRPPTPTTPKPRARTGSRRRTSRRSDGPRRIGLTKAPPARSSPSPAHKSPAPTRSRSMTRLSIVPPVRTRDSTGMGRSRPRRSGEGQGGRRREGDDGPHRRRRPTRPSRSPTDAKVFGLSARRPRRRAGGPGGPEGDQGGGAR